MPTIESLQKGSSAQRGGLNHQAIEDYVKTIYFLAEDESPVSTSRLSEARAVKPASATGMIRRLAELNLVHYEKHRGVTLTKDGEKIALEVIRHHRLLELFLKTALGFADDEVHEQADILEHVISEELEDKIAKVLGNPQFDPHGQPIPSKALAMGEKRSIHAESQAIWETNAGFWDDKVGEAGNRFHQTLISPETHKLLDIKEGETVLDVACGNGQFAREMARLGALVTAFDFAPTFVERAKKHSVSLPDVPKISYHVADATDEAAVLALGKPDSFDAAVSNMAFMDISDIRPTLRAVYQLLKPNGRFVFNVSHPVFNSVGMERVMEQENTDEGVVERTAVKLKRYASMEGQPTQGDGIVGQPEQQYYFDRTLSGYLRLCFEAGFVVDGMSEPQYVPPERDGRAFTWSRFTEFPPILIVRLRKI